MVTEVKLGVRVTLAVALAKLLPLLLKVARTLLRGERKRGRRRWSLCRWAGKDGRHTLDFAWSSVAAQAFSGKLCSAFAFCIVLNWMVELDAAQKGWLADGRVVYAFMRRGKGGGIAWYCLFD